ncbi:MAG: four-carbon acid sugar kinase family protein [Mobilitalea sp.]
MIEILILADDITGALDTGVKFAVSGATVRVATDLSYDFMKEISNTEVLVFNTETRHLPFQEAYEIVFDIVRKAMIAGIPHIFKKTDSALRGNIGSELTALLDASDEKMLPFIPAYPQMNRYTMDGIHYISGIPVHLSEFGKDPFEPVKSSYIPNIIHDQNNIYTETVPIVKGKPFIYHDESNKGIYIFDARTENDLIRITKNLNNQKRLRIMAGCAGLASTLPKIFGLKGKRQIMPKLPPKFLMICGSINQISRKQLDYAEKNGFRREHLSMEQKVEHKYFESESGKTSIEKMIAICKSNSRIIIDTGDSNTFDDTVLYAKEHDISVDDIRVNISDNLALLTGKLLKAESDMTLMITGGDTLTGFLNGIGCNELIPIGELEPGSVLSKFWREGKEFYVISKSGGFGDKELIVNLANTIVKDKER